MKKPSSGVLLSPIGALALGVDLREGSDGKPSESARLDPGSAKGPLYDNDVYGWALRQAGLIRAGRFSELDLENVAEEIESVGKSERSSLESALVRVMQHMLKWDYQPEKRTRSWINSISVHRVHAARRMKQNPGLKPELDAILDDAYRIGLLHAAEETGLLEDEFPRSRPYALGDVMERTFRLSDGEA